MKLPDRVNYIAALLTFRCSLHCKYCIERRAWARNKERSPEEWVDFLLGITEESDVPITLQGGEPTEFRGWSKIAKELYCKGKKVHLLTNLLGEYYKEFNEVDGYMFNRKLGYPSVRVSFHPGYTQVATMVSRAKQLTRWGFNVGVYAVRVPGMEIEIEDARELCRVFEIPFFTKEYLDENSGTYAHPDAVKGVRVGKSVLCRPNELIIAPDLKVYPCAGKLVRGVNGRKAFQSRYKECLDYGLCSPCDIKVKLDRFGNSGYSSVTIKESEKRG